MFSYALTTLTLAVLVAFTLAAPVLDTATLLNNGQEAQNLNARFQTLEETDSCTGMTRIIQQFLYSYSSQWEKPHAYQEILRTVGMEIGRLEAALHPRNALRCPLCKRQALYGLLFEHLKMILNLFPPGC